MNKVSRIPVPVDELLLLLARSLNTMEPAKAPKWAMDLSDELRSTDEVTITVTRNVDQIRPDTVAENKPA